MAFVLHSLFQRHDMPPDEFAKKARHIQRFIIASEQLYYEELPKPSERGR